MSDNIIDLRSCLEGNYEGYINVAEHVVDTLENDKYVLEDRFREDMKKLCEAMCKCATGEKEELWCEVADKLGPTEKEEERTKGITMEEFDAEPTRPSDVDYRGGYVQKNPGRR